MPSFYRLLPIIAILGLSASVVDAFVPPSPTHVIKIHHRRHQTARQPLLASISDLFTPAMLPMGSQTGAPTMRMVEALPDTNIFDSLFQLPVFWSLSIMLIIVALLYTWETAIKLVRTRTPAPLLPVIESMLAEVGGLGFIGLVLQIAVAPAEPWIGQLSEKFLGSEEILIESFEFLHSAFFEVGISFFIAAGGMVSICLGDLSRMKTMAGIGLDSRGTCMSTSVGLADMLDAPTIPCGATGDCMTDDEALIYLKPKVLDELSMDAGKRGAQFLLLREQMLRSNMVGEDFVVNDFLEQVFAKTLYEMVELSPLTWLPLIPAIALANSVDLSHDVVNAASPNAAESAGFFFSTPLAIIPNTGLVALSVVWGIWNYWKMTKVKNMLVPTLVRDGADGDRVRILPPRYTCKEEMQAFSSTPAWMSPIEKFFGGEPAENTKESLFGAAGSAGIELYLLSIKYHSFLCITSIVFFGSQILPRDLGALLSGATVGDPIHLVPELVTYASFVAVSVFQLALSPTSFFNFCLAKDMMLPDEYNEQL